METAKTLAETVKMNYRNTGRMGAGLWQNMTRWAVTLSYQGRKIDLPYYTGSAIPKPITADVLHCLIIDRQFVQNGYSDFINDMGYDDNKEARLMFERAKLGAKKIEMLLGADLARFEAAFRDY